MIWDNLVVISTYTESHALSLLTVALCKLVRANGQSPIMEKWDGGDIKDTTSLSLIIVVVAVQIQLGE